LQAAEEPLQQRQKLLPGEHRGPAPAHSGFVNTALVVCSHKFASTADCVIILLTITDD